MLSLLYKFNISKVQQKGYIYAYTPYHRIVTGIKKKSMRTVITY